MNNVKVPFLEILKIYIFQYFLRYVTNHQELSVRRSPVKDVYEWLNSNLSNVVELLQSKVNSELKNKLTDMRMKELSDLMFSKPKDLSNEESQGRQSGSLAWRLSRQETTQGYVIKPNSKEIEDLKIDISYDIIRDEYTRKNVNETIKNWSAFTFNNENIFKKEEQDWKMVYLARKENDKSSKIVWKIDLKDCQLQVRVKSL